MKNIQLISASAGSGKTFRLMNEIAEHIAGNGDVSHVQPEQIMATTFTNKAAAELKERIRMRLLEEGKAAEAQRIYDGLIGTVNSVCSKLLKEYAFEAGLSPAVDVLLEEDATRIFNMATASAIAEAGKSLEKIARRLGLMGYGNKYAKQADWREQVQCIVNLARSNGMDKNTLKAAAAASWESLEALLGEGHSDSMGVGMDKRLADAVNESVLAIQNNDTDSTGVTKTALSTLQKVQRTIRSFGVSSLSWEDWLGLSAVTPGAKSKDLVEDVQNIASEHIKHPRFRQDLESMIKGVFACAADALEQYAAYKREQGLMDFVDQEALVLNMATHNDSFRASMKERVKLLMVDEFQDTSPIQLALFLKLSELAEEVIWVGDQKQSIYGFRGADPALMDSVAAEIEKASTAKSNHILNHSWRSKQALVEFCNAIFSPVFHSMDEDKVCLNIPDVRKDSAAGGWIENWLLEGSNLSKRSHALVLGVQEMIKDRQIKAGDIAILCRSNSECEEVSSSLKQAGIRASISEGDLLATQECTLAIAALRYMADHQDNIALAEIVCFSNQHKSHDGWLAELLQNSEATQMIWKQDELIQTLAETGKKGVYLSPLESLEQAMAAIKLERTVYAWGDVEQRLSNLDELRAACIDYQDRCTSRRDSATVSGFLTWIFGEAELKQAKSSGEDTVNVLTYHKSKGLEWPVVIMNSLNKESRSGVFGISVVEAEEFKAEEPLADRSLRYWPWPYGIKKKAENLDACLAGSSIADKALKNSLSESNRVLYVGLTRAKDGLVLLQQKNKSAVSSKWLEELTNAKKEPVLSFADGAASIVNRSGEEKVFQVTTRHYMGSGGVNEQEIQDKSCYLPLEQHESVPYPAVSIAPSNVDWDDEVKTSVQTSIVEDLGISLNKKGVFDAADFGEAMHGFLGADFHIDEAARIAQAQGLLHAWKVSHAIEPEGMLEASDRLKKFIQSKYSNGKVLSEWPITMKLSNQQNLSGWIDMLIELDDGYVVIDHKSYSGVNATEHAKEYAPQLDVYKTAVEQATGKPVLNTLIHFPMLGEIVDVSCI